MTAMKTTILERPSSTATDDPYVCNVLMPLIQANLDAKEGFRQAADHAEHPDLKAEFTYQSTRREEFVQDLQQIQFDHGRLRVDDSGTVSGAIHRAWIGFKTALVQQDDQMLLDEVLKGEEETYALYREKLDTELSLPAGVREVLATHALAIQQSLGKIREWRNSGRFVKVEV